MLPNGFEREIVPPNDDRRRFILSKLAALRGVQKAQAIKQALREELHQCNGHIRYYYTHKGIKIAVGTEFDKKKYFLIYKDRLALQPIVKSWRARTRTKDIIVPVERRVNKYNKILRYHKTGGVLTKPSIFSSKAREYKKEHVYVYKAPKTKDYYIGLEIELTSKITADQAVDKIVDLGLQDYVRVMRDGSIQVTDREYPHTMEFCILMRFSEISEVLSKMQILLKDGFQANASCGLHVHLDMRKSDFKRVFANLVSMQEVLFGLSASHRAGNRFCLPVATTSFDQANDRDHYAAISKFAFNKHGTIEVRMHHATTDLQVVEKWITLLKIIGDYNGPALLAPGNQKFELTQLKDIVKPAPEIMKYVEETVRLA